jgi:hypothetical protein
MMILTIKPRGRGNWRTSEIRGAGEMFRPGDTIDVSGRLYRVVSIRPAEATC